MSSKITSTRNGEKFRQECGLQLLKILFVLDFFGQQNCKKYVEKKGRAGRGRVGSNERSDCVSHSDESIRREIVTALSIQRQRLYVRKI